MCVFIKVSAFCVCMCAFKSVCVCVFVQMWWVCLVYELLTGVLECVHGGGGGCALYSSGEAWEPHSCQQPGLMVGYTASPMSGCLCARVCKRAVCWILASCEKIFILNFNSLIFKYIYKYCRFCVNYIIFKKYISPQCSISQNLSIFKEFSIHLIFFFLGGG